MHHIYWCIPTGEIMNARDRENLFFLLNVSQETFDEWANDVDIEDIEYALNLVREAKLEIIERAIDKIDEVGDVTEAKYILERIKNK